MLYNRLQNSQIFSNENTVKIKCRQKQLTTTDQITGFLKNLNKKINIRKCKNKIFESKVYSVYVTSN